MMTNQESYASAVNSTNSKTNQDSFTDALKLLSGALVEGIKGILLSNDERREGSKEHGVTQDLSQLIKPQ